MTANVTNMPQPALTARQLRRKRARMLAIRLLVGVVLPTLLAALYYGLVATPQYESVCVFTIQSADGGSGLGLDLLLGGVGGSASGRDALIARDYVESRDMLDHLEAKHRFVEHYTASWIDFGSRLSGDASREDRYDYYRDHVDVSHDTQSSAVTLRVRAFSADRAHKLAQAVLSRSQAMVNDMMERAREDRLTMTRREVAHAEELLSGARRAVVAKQAELGELSPVESATALYGVRANFEAELAAARAELTALRATLQPDAPAVREVRQRVAALTAEIDKLNERLAGDEGGLGASIAEIEPLLAQKEMATQAYLSALKSLELARVDADRQHRYLVTIANPSSPDEPTHPRFFRSVLTAFLLSFAILGIGTLIVASIREHANV